jgi:ADP-heptose:LPS heptosyltransferase
MSNVLVIRLSAMGDVAMTVPVVASVLQQHPDLHITLISNPRFEAMFGKLERFTFVGVDTKVKYHGLAGIFRLFRDLRRANRFDAVADLHDVLRSMVLRTLFRLSGVKVSHINKGRAEKRALVSASHKQLHQLQTSVSRYCEVFGRLGLSVIPHFTSICSKEHPPVSPLGAKQGQWVGVAPFAQHKGKIYPLDKMEQVVRRLAERSGMRVLLFGGGPKEVAVLEGWAAASESVTSVAGKYPLRDELAILNQCDVLVSMDSANMHLASLVATPVVSVWGATHPFAGFYGYGQNTENIVQCADLDCRPCSIYGNKPCLRGDYACLNGIEPDRIVDKVMKVLSDCV